MLVINQCFTSLPTKRLYTSFLILPQNKPFSLVYTVECMINYIIYRCQYETVLENLSGRLRHGPHAVCEKFMSFVCQLLVFGVPLLNVNLGWFRVRVNYSLFETHGAICANLPLVLFISLL